MSLLEGFSILLPKNIGPSSSTRLTLSNLTIESVISRKEIVFGTKELEKMFIQSSVKSRGKGEKKAFPHIKE